jgi:hypothetical protein
MGHEKLFEVHIWSDTPWDTDTCWCGEEFATEEEARVVFEKPETCFRPGDCHNVYLTLTGPGIDEVKTLGKPRSNSDQDWKREQAMEAGMLHGIDAYNDSYGY